ncbi:hypothetical protein C9439_02765 [archaeon SCG-AAA382B04]|nr:hypothetical protein C9439_02765 [archaeon SCG-AAA382B04]
MESIPYLEWMKDKLSQIEYDLARTGLRCSNNQSSFFPKSVKNENTSKDELKQILSQEYDLRPENFLITSGATFANYLITLFLKDKVKKFLVEKPAYQPLYYTPDHLESK